MFLYGQYALLLAAYNTMIWFVAEVPWPVQRKSGFWWDKKYRVNWRSNRTSPQKRRNYCARFYSRSRKRGSRVCWKTAEFGTRTKNSKKKSGVSVHVSIREHVSDGRNIANEDHANLPHSCTSTIRGTGTRDTGPSCLPCTTTYDTDSKWLGIDSLSTYCITNDMKDYVQDPTPISREVRGIQSSPAIITYVGVGKFSITDELGQICELPVDRLYYCSSAPVKILSPQHLDKMWRAQHKNNKFEATVNSDGCTIRWKLDNTVHTKFIKIDGRTGVPVCKTAPGFKKAREYFAANALSFDDETKMNVVLSAYNMQNQEEEPLLRETLDIDVEDVKKNPRVRAEPFWW